MTTKKATSQGGSGVRECPCSRVVRDVFLCQSCVGRFERLMVQALGLLEDLTVTMSRLDQVGVAGFRGGSGQGRVLPLRLDASKAHEELRKALGGVSRPVRELAASSEGPAVLERLEGAVAAAVRVVDLPPEMIHIGACGKVFEGVECEQELFVTVEQASVACEVCGTLWDVSDRRSSAIRSAWKAIAPPRVIVAALQSQGVRVAVKDIENWAQLGHLSRAVDPVSGVSGFRVSEVFVVAQRMVAKRAKTRSK
ncbi:hypothetical protein [Acaricomes phytoseiuli]|uniref:hypothetical protein n=1 Tax=Acaricomes phytoseiuli TaxID=291968 RepID=UPI000368850D|nr:hypothetical protein [Acaricomes phytoseiuli]